MFSESQNLSNDEMEKKDTHVLAVSPLLPVDLEIPSKSGLEIHLLLRVVEINPFVAVRLPVWCNVDYRDDIQTSCNQDALNERVVGSAEDPQGAKEVFTGSF
jgi:hypothetical protein